MKPETKIAKIHSIIKELCDEAEQTKGQYAPYNCPMLYDNNHYQNAQILDGLGCWKWNCPFCGEEFQG